MSDLSNRVRQALAFDEQRTWLIIAEALKEKGLPAIPKYNSANIGAKTERARTSALDAALCDAVGALEAIASLDLSEDELENIPSEESETIYAAREALTRIELALSEGK